MLINDDVIHGSSFLTKETIKLLIKYNCGIQVDFSANSYWIIYAGQALCYMYCEEGYYLVSGKIFEENVNV